MFTVHNFLTIEKSAIGAIDYLCKVWHHATTTTATKDCCGFSISRRIALYKRERKKRMNNLSKISKPNRDVRLAVADEGFYLWQLAAELGITDGTLSKKLRRELSESEKEACYNAIARMKKTRQHSNEE